MRPQTMRRVARHLLFVALTGCAISIAIACCLTRWTSMAPGQAIAKDRRTGPASYFTYDESLTWPDGAPVHWPEPQQGFFGSGIGVRFSGYHYSRGFNAHEVRRLDVREVRAGWPFLCLGWQSWKDEFDSMRGGVGGVGRQNVRVPGTNRPYIDLKRWLTPRGTAVYALNEVHQRLPLAPLWPGLVFNTLMYGGLVWFCCFGVFAWRKRRRLRRGCCPACGYPAGVSDVCSECGGPVMRTG